MSSSEHDEYSGSIPSQTHDDQQAEVTEVYFHQTSDDDTPRCASSHYPHLTLYDDLSPTSNVSTKSEHFFYHFLAVPVSWGNKFHMVDCGFLRYDSPDRCRILVGPNFHPREYCVLIQDDDILKAKDETRAISRASPLARTPPTPWLW